MLSELRMPGGLNIAYHALDRHVVEGRGDKLALRWLGKNAEKRDITYRELLELSCRFANVLRGLGVRQGDRVFSLLGRVPELYIAALGTLRNGSVFSPLFSAFGPEPVRTRMAIGEAKVLVTTAAFYRRKVAEWRRELPGLEHVLLRRRSPVPRRHNRLQCGNGAIQCWIAACRYRARGLGAVALHQRYHRPAKRCNARA